MRVVFDPQKIPYNEILAVFWENHDPTQGMKQGNDSGTQYRSGIYYYNEEQKVMALHTKEVMQQELKQKGYPDITTEIIPVPEFYYAEDNHQQYLGKNPGGYCGLGGNRGQLPSGGGQKTRKDLKHLNYVEAMKLN